MIVVAKILDDALERIPTTIATATATTTTTMGVISKFSEGMPTLHDILGNMAIAAGIVAFLALAIVRRKRAKLLDEQQKNVALQSRLRQIEIDKLERNE